jgi:hypothetical protein
MAQRIAQLIGYTTGCTIQIDWNGSLVFSGHVDPAGDTENPTVLAQWNTDTTVTGAVPLGIQCASGSLWFVNVYVNMWQSYVERSISPQAQWPSHVPASEDELWADWVDLDDTELQQKYGLSRVVIRKQNIIKTETISIEDFFVQPSLDQSDGKNNVMINDMAENRHDLDMFNGTWHWRLDDGDTFSCDFTVDTPRQPPPTQG